jgi:hypothetical protein
MSSSIVGGTNNRIDVWMIVLLSGGSGCALAVNLLSIDMYPKETPRRPFEPEKPDS